ncbi:MAG: class I SAM-dependent methyltransferase [Anaerolineaceae bacterium]|nr:class I SAM-dependent methyltransferase [Anaerolineaceae bacterium]
MNEFLFSCPCCGTDLVEVDPNTQRCPAEGITFRREDGIWRFLPPQAEENYRQFIQEYQTVRQAEGRGSSQPEFYRALPFQDLSRRFSSDWHIRARSFQVFLERILTRLERQTGQPLQILDLGSGNGWLSYRLAQRGHHLAAVDMITNSLDGLGAYIYYNKPFTPVQAEFNHLPFSSLQMDCLIYNASFHYSTNYEVSLKEAIRVIKPHGQIIILDSPVYHHASSGEMMVEERQSQFLEKYGFPSNAISSENFLTYQRLQQLSSNLSIRWNIIYPFYGLRWALRPWKARLLGQREPASFMIISGSFTQNG